MLELPEMVMSLVKRLSTKELIPYIRQQEGKKADEENWKLFCWGLKQWKDEKKLKRGKKSKEKKQKNKGEGGKERKENIKKERNNERKNKE